jgi:hypothetical protein
VNLLEVVIAFDATVGLIVLCLIYQLAHEQARRWSIWLEYKRDRECVEIASDGKPYISYVSAKNKYTYIERLERI